MVSLMRAHNTLKALSICVALCFSSSAQANVIDLGTLTPGATNFPVPGALTFTPIAVPGLSLYQLTGTVSGVLPANSIVTFSYLFSNAIAGSSTVTSTFNTDVTPTSASVINSGGSTASAPLGFVSANLALPSSATNIIGNNGSSSVTFASILSLILSSNAIGTLTYSVSSVPLPASFPLFLMLIGGLYFVSRMNKNRTPRQGIAA